MYYREPWNADRVAYLLEWWPHFGTYVCAEQLGLTRGQVKSKADKMGIKMLPKKDRLCLSCRTGHQFSRHAGVHCNTCHLARRKSIRRSQERSLERWIAEATNNARHRSRTPSDLTTEYMIALWHQQKGHCYYSGLALKPPTYGNGRDPFSPSIDRIDPKQGYIQGNVVWAAWVCNAGKSDLTPEQYITLCAQVAHYQQSLR